MEIVSGNLPISGTAALLPGAFHPPTVAHWGLAMAALQRVDRVVFVLPREFPHKSYGDLPLEVRLRMLSTLIQGQQRLAVCVSDGGLFADMAREFRALAPGCGVPWLLCGRDAAERIVSWPYPESSPITVQLTAYRLLVASRGGDYEPPAELRPHIENLNGAWDEISSSAVRAAISEGRDWRALVPEPVHNLVEEIYSRSRFDSRNARSR